ncbi:MAG: HAD-IIB family hydrolase [bacterium]
MTQEGTYVQLFSIHGLIRGNSPQLGRDADTGGQIKYVLELTKALARLPEIRQVDLFTRFIEDMSVSEDYSRAIEPLSDKARIVRIRCGGKKYIRKELLWPHLDEFVDKSLKFIKGQNLFPDFCHGHYSDGGYVAMELSGILDTPFIFTGHSMGRNKKNKLLKNSKNPGKIIKQYKLDHRIEIEEKIIKNSDMIITSTNQEIKEQYGLYNNFPSGCYRVIPPGIDLDTFYPYYTGYFDTKKLDAEVNKQVITSLLHELRRFWRKPEKPFVLALCRPDHRKNINGLIEAYGEDKELQAIANLAIFAGIRKNINDMEDNERHVLTEMLLLMDKYDLYGKMAIPKKHDFAMEIPKLYRLCANSRGIFVNPSLIEPFGLTLIEASACGLPIIATNNGGPTDIVGNCDNGILINPDNPKEIAEAARKILVDDNLWKKFSENGINGVRSHYSWDSHCAKLHSELESLESRRAAGKRIGGVKSEGIGKRLTSLKKFIITDIDNTLIGDDEATLQLLNIIRKNSRILGWGVASGRSLELILEVLHENKVPIPDVIISSVGTEIYYGKELFPDKGWDSHLNKHWRPENIRRVLSAFDFIYPQEKKTERKYKISYLMEENPDHLAKIHNRLQSVRLRYNLVFSHHQFLDILPFRASKGKAVNYLSYKWEIPSANIMDCGDSGNDADMLKGSSIKGLVVGNYSQELEKLRGSKNIYFSGKSYANGIIDGINYYKLIRE